MLDTTEQLHFHFSLTCIGEGNGNPLQCSCLENPRDRGAWWAAVSGVSQSQTRLKRLSSSSSSNLFIHKSSLIFFYFYICSCSLFFLPVSVFTCWQLLGISKLLLPSAKKYSPKIESNWAGINDKTTFLSNWGNRETKSRGGLVHAEGPWNSDACQEVTGARQQVFLECTGYQALRARYTASHWICMWGG